jgi:chromosome segregation ATPase
MTRPDLIILENQRLKEQLKLINHQLLRADEDRNRILDQRNLTIKERDRNYAQIEKLTERIKCLQSDHAKTLASNSSLREELIQKDKTIKALGEGISNANHIMRNDSITISNLKSELNQLEQDYASMKARFHGANYGVGYDVFKEKANYELTINRLKAELDALKHLCHERGFGTPIIPAFYSPDKPKPKPTWKATFVANNCTKGIVTFHRAPTIQELDQLQRIFEATSWSVILP